MPSIINATTSTGLVTTADNSGSLQLATNSGTTALTIDTSQNVGIGTASPAYKVDINGRTRSADFGMTNSTQNYYHFDSFTGNNFMGLPSANTLGIYVAGSERMRINSSGDVFVGGTSLASANKPVYAQNTVKAWLNYNAVSQTVVASFNVSSVTYNSQGNYTVNFTTAMPNSSYAAVFGAQDTSTGAEFLAGRVSGTKTTSAFQIQNWNYTGGVVNSSGVYVAILGA